VRVPNARRLRHAMTDAERKLWWRLRELPVDNTHFRRQATIGPYFADFACHRCKLVIEVDGGQHAAPAQAAADLLRTEFLASRGYRVLRFWNHEVLMNIEGVLTVIYAALQAEAPLPPTPDPSPPRAKSAWGEGN
jgi:very-short-patch-repair endonuclease